MINEVSQFVLGINAFHEDSSAAIIHNGKVICAIEEERLTRVKHWSGFPIESIKRCLRDANIDIKQVEHIAINHDPKANLFQKIKFLLINQPYKLISKSVNRLKTKTSVLEFLKNELGQDLNNNTKLHFVEHHLAHLSSSFLCSNFDSAVCVSVDGFGDFSSSVWGIANADNTIKVHQKVFFPHSLGILYEAITQFLGFQSYGDEYKVMGMTSYGTPKFKGKLSKLVEFKGSKFRLNLDYFVHHIEQIEIKTDDGSLKRGNLFSKRLVDLLGPPRKPNEKITQRHIDIAASLQYVYEDIFFKFLNSISQNYNTKNLCLSGGCAMNSLANGKIEERTNFKNIYIPPAPGDSGGAIGAALFISSKIKNYRKHYLDNAYLGPKLDKKEIDEVLINAKLRTDFIVRNFKNDNDLSSFLAKEISKGKIIGWYQGRMEFGPRALGNRSIIGDPRNPKMKDLLNTKIKLRETFRPFAPSILEGEVSNWFEKVCHVPFMSRVFKIRTEKQKLIPAVTHNDGTGRLQTVAKKTNDKFYRLIEAFYSLTGVPILLNTSFNENEPIVSSPKEAYSTFSRTKMDILVLNNEVVMRVDEIG